jgi:multidrug transporter EmrE-like cation transporter
MTKAQAAFCVALTIGLTVYGQLVVKWQVLQAGEFPGALGERVEFMLRLLANPWIISVFAAAAIAALAWMAAMTRLELSVAYPFVATTFALVLILSGVFFDEAITTAKTLGVGLIILGIVVASR